MNRKEIMNLEEKPLLDLVEKNFNIKLDGVKDEENICAAWQIVDILAQKGWMINIRRDPDLKNVDGCKFNNGPGTIFAQYGSLPNFNTISEGICKTSLIALKSTEGIKTD
ncbi:MAG: hypothetical protein K9L17_00080 [Clostridiales bacterium]|nr:hypothetical protein [Clostridiales bacterium]MCF8021088.1 hypothetical protein [Clostridiales bacterium]